ncbi:MAG: hypothetical protein NTV40_00500 [Solirubrobacterales bacterium]|nr:hypothetical protein [Solirubrobacterales bacterium]
MNAPPRQIYSSSLSRRERVWRGSRYRRRSSLSRLPFLGILLTLSIGLIAVVLVVVAPIFV